MKNSEVDWIGDIPVDWNIVSTRSLWKERDEVSINPSEDELLSVSEYYGVDYRKNRIRESDVLVRAESLEGYKQCHSGDFVMNYMLAWKGAHAISPYCGIVSPSYAVFLPRRKMHAQYFHYLYRTDSYKSAFARYSTGIIPSRLRLYPKVFLKMPTIQPPH